MPKESFRKAKRWHREEIHMRDSFVFTSRSEETYYLFGTTFADGQGDIEPQFEVYISSDLEEWEGPYCAFHPQKGFWGVRHYWAPEVFELNGRFYMFATFKGGIGVHRGTGILVADQPEGPYEPLVNEPATPPEWECLDGTYHRDKEGQNWIVFCHEWTTEYEGKIMAQRLSEDLTQRIGKPFEILNAAKMPWIEKFGDPRIEKDGYLTDAPFFYTTKDGELLMLWSSYSKPELRPDGKSGYTVAIARSKSGDMTGPWTHDEELLMNFNAGHPSLFHDFSGALHICTHYPDTPHGNERPLFLPVEEINNTIVIKEKPDYINWR
ncbi:glycoside hydrolase family 43 protein [Jeotgalibacillus proteolyticus]|uniref:Glycoside hydrolase n=1 Tax=Jeotgalibacillus proteolyticus TaxID=2082395 RepID=A0A2S5G9M7_9BACL|nr:glycoside hydrolase family 43 protein [Jeotgalibacillus proteolyticus]PPA69623.1 glycoside hydrolase [Jeotgalibacillus proteolyticus]